MFHRKKVMDQDSTSSIPFRPPATRPTTSVPTKETKTTIQTPLNHSQLSPLSQHSSSSQNTFAGVPSQDITTSADNLDELVASLETALHKTTFHDSDQSPSPASEEAITSSSCGQLNRTSSSGTSSFTPDSGATSSVVSSSDMSSNPPLPKIQNSNNKTYQNGVVHKPTMHEVSSNHIPNNINHPTNFPTHSIPIPSVPRIVCVQPNAQSISPSSATSILPSDHVPSMRSIRVLPKTQSLDIVDEDNDELIVGAGSGLRTANRSKPIYPNVPYSPYGSPFGSPRGRKRQPFRESRRVSVENVGSFLQLNQYQLFDKIGQVIKSIMNI